MDLERASDSSFQFPPSFPAIRDLQGYFCEMQGGPI